MRLGGHRPPALPWGPRTPGPECILSPGFVSIQKPDRVPRSQRSPPHPSPLLGSSRFSKISPPPLVSCVHIYSGATNVTSLPKWIVPFSCLQSPSHLSRGEPGAAGRRVLLEPKPES